MLADPPDGVVFIPTEDDEAISGAALAALQEQTSHATNVVAAARAGDVDGALAALERHRLLCAHRSGPRGERWWSDAVERWLAAADPTLVPAAGRALRRAAAAW